MSLCLNACIYYNKQWNMLFTTLKRYSSQGLIIFACFFSWQKVILFIHYFYYMWKNQYICSIFSSYWFHIADTFTLFPLLVKDNVCKSNSDLRVNLKEIKIWDLQWEKLSSTFDPKAAYGTCESSHCSRCLCAVLKWYWSTQLSTELA